MQNALRPSSLVPAGFAVTSAASVGPVTTLEIRSTGATSRCPACGVASRRVHSRYRRRIVDLPIAGRSVELVATVRRFRCVAVLCRRSIFTERFDDGVLTPWGRRTARLDGLVHHLGLALGGRPGAGFAKRLMLPVSNDTLLRVVRRHGCPKAPAPPRSASTTGPGDVIIAMGLSSVISSAPHRRPPSRSRACHGPGMAERAAPDRHRRPRQGRRLCPGRNQGAAARCPGRRSLASDGERQPRFPRRGPQVDASDQDCHRHHDDQP